VTPPQETIVNQYDRLKIQVFNYRNCNRGEPARSRPFAEYDPESAIHTFRPGKSPPLQDVNGFATMNREIIA
jgi:hypothetical protein